MSDDRQIRERELTALLDHLHRTRGLDLSGYKRVGLLRRLTKRMRTVGASGFGDYLQFLDSHPSEFTGLLDTLLINVTAFFRDDLPWDFLRTEIIPQIVAQKGPTEAIRVWCAGCASGEEAYRPPAQLLQRQANSRQGRVGILGHEGVVVSHQGDIAR